MRIVSALAAAALSVVVASQAHAVIFLDGVVDGAYGAMKSHVNFSESAPEHNFEAPTAFSKTTSYDIFLAYDFRQRLRPASEHLAESEHQWCCVGQSVLRHE